MITAMNQCAFDDSFEGQMRLISEIKRQDQELQEIRLLNERLADSKPSLNEILERYGVKQLE